METKKRVVEMVFFSSYCPKCHNRWYREPGEKKEYPRCGTVKVFCSTGDYDD